MYIYVYVHICVIAFLRGIYIYYQPSRGICGIYIWAQQIFHTWEIRGTMFTFLCAAHMGIISGASQYFSFISTWVLAHPVVLQILLGRTTNLLWF
uniref:Putative product n=1 Tax=Xenopsylla cheopis TaxID=163159 RepID=A0A6M2DX99_XENCH